MFDNIKKKLFFVLLFLVFATNVAHGWMLGVNVSGSEYSWETYPIASHLDYLKDRGIVLIRLPVAWEKFQSALNGPLNQTEVGKLKSFLDLVDSRGMQVILDIHNYGRYNPNWEADAVANWGIVAVNNNSGLLLGSSLPISAFKDLWTKLAGELVGHASLVGYDIMNEPHGLGADIWPVAAQAAVDGIRSVDMNTTIYVEGAFWASAYHWPIYNGDLNIIDPANKIIYEAHLYFDDGSGTYTQTYDQYGAYPNKGVDRVQPFLDWLQQNNAKGFIGEFGVPKDDPRWLVLLDNFLNTLKQNDVSGTYWYYSYGDPSGANSWWPITTGVDFSMSLIPESDGQDKPQWGIITKYTESPPSSPNYGRISGPYSYLVAFGITIAFIGISLIVLTRKQP
jgi:endoglucanase